MNTFYYTTYDFPIPYKELKIYPVKVKDYLIFNVYSQCLLIDKNSIPDPKIITMTDLEYIYKATEENLEKTPYLIWFDRLLSLCLKDEKSFENLSESIKRYKYDAKKKPYFEIGEIKYFSDDFLEIRNIIAEQNNVDLIDKTVSKEVRDSLEKARAYKNKMADSKPGSLEDHIISICAATGWTLEYVQEMTIRKFVKTIKRLDNLIHYKIYMTALMSGMVEFKDKSFIKHWLVDLEDSNRYGDVSLDLNVVQDKVSLESAKK